MRRRIVHDKDMSQDQSNGHMLADAAQWLKEEPSRLRTVEEKDVPSVQDLHKGLEVFDLQGAPLSCLWFGPVYFRTSRIEKVVLKNNAPQACDWVCLLQDTAAGTEMGTDLQKSTDAALLEKMGKCSPIAQDVSQVLVCVPSQGRLKPYEETTVAVCFSPVCKSSCDKRRDYFANLQDYCLFLLFDTVESRHGLNNFNGSSVELAVTGSGLPVSLVPSPSRFDFLTCLTGQRVDLQCVLQNLCPQLPVNYRFCKLAHFNTKPSTGVIAPGQCQDVVVSFVPRQQGSFQVCLKLDVLDYAVWNKGNTAEDVTGLELRSIHTIPLHLSAVCCCETTHPGPKLTAAVTNPSGLLPYARNSDLSGSHGKVDAAVLSANKTRLHKHCREEQDTKREKTIFTGGNSYHYADTNYAFTDEEEEQRRQHRQIYTDFIHNLRKTRLEKERQQEMMEISVDIGIVPAQGLVPPSLTDLRCLKISETKPDSSNAFPIKYRCPSHMTSITQQVNSQEVMAAMPSNSQMVADCNKILTAKELYQVVIDPLVVDFGEVCVQSVCVQKLKLTNNLPVFVWLQLEVDCPELQGSSPLSHVLAPHSRNSLPLIFQSNKLGRFYRRVAYSVNRQHPGQILVQAEVVPLALELSTTQLVLHPNPTLLTQSGYRSSVTLRNHFNHAAEFTWRPVVTEKGIMFSIRPATGLVEPYKELDCEVVFYPSFSSSPQGDFDLCVQEGSKQRLHCAAKVATTSVHLAEYRLIFGSVPLNMPSIRTAVLYNTGKHHAVFQVRDVCPWRGLDVSPAEGVVPSGGQATLRIRLNPDSVIKFDTTVKIALRNMKCIELRVGGSVEPPNIQISVSHFQFHGVYAGSQRAIPFSLTNQSSALARVTFDLTEHTDFSVQLAQPSEKKKQSENVVEVEGKQTVDCYVVFSPTHVAGYDFELPMMVNGVRWPVNTATQQSHRIRAIVLCAPMEMSPSSLEFLVGPQSDAYIQTVELKAVCEESVFWRFHVSKHVKWWFDCGAITVPTEKRAEGGLCMVSPSSGSLGPSQSICLTVSINPKAITTGFDRVTKVSIPLYLEDEDGERMGEGKEYKPYRQLSIIIALPFITIHPPQIFLPPVPLDCLATATVTLRASGYPSEVAVSAEVEKVELEDGTKIQPISVTFREGYNITAENQDQSYPVSSQEPRVTSLICSVGFSSTFPLSLCTTITFTDHLQNRFKVKLCAVADNCLLTIWPYMALHRSEQQIVVQSVTGTTAVVLQRYHTPSPTSGPASSSSSSFDHSSTNKNSDSDYFPDSDSVSSQASRSTKVSPNRDTPTNLGIPEFPTADTEEGLYYQNVLRAVERWFSFFGWPSGPCPISVPDTLRRVVSKIQMSHSSGRTYRVSLNIDSRSIADMLRHLTGKQIPGIPRCQTLPTDINQRTTQLLQQHEAMLHFLRVQGACLGHIRPAYLLDLQEFKHWCSLQSQEEERGLDYSSVDYESLSKRSWTDVLLQIYKVLVLCRVSNSGLTLNHDAGAGILPASSQPPNSNIYSSCECKLLSWLNLHYQSMRTTVWATGGVPPERWIVNFDLDLTDGLVLAAVLAAFCPYLICSHFRRMYTTIGSQEHILHNNIIVAQALTALSLNIDVQPTDLSIPNPVQMSILCVHLYELLPQYLPLQTITLSGGLHSTFSKQVRLKNPSSTPIEYQVRLCGEDAHHFSLPGGSSVTIPPKASAEVSVQFSCFFLKPMEAFLLLTSSSPFGMYGRTLTFNLKTHVSRIAHTNAVKCQSPCYKLKVIQVPITNLFKKEAKFSVVLLESPFNPLKPGRTGSLVGQASSKADMKTTPDKGCGKEMEETCSDINGESSEFLRSVRSVCLQPGEAYTLNISYLPFYTGTKYCYVLLACPQVGDMVYVVEATAELPLPSPLSARPSPNNDSILSTSDPGVCVSVVTLHCKVGQVCDEMLRVPLVNLAWEEALASLGQHNMSADEHKRRLLTHTLHSSTLRATTAVCKLFKHQAQLLRDVHHSKRLKYSVEVKCPKHFALPNTVTIPIKEDTSIWQNAADSGFVDIPVRFQADSMGMFTCQVVLRSWHDTRVYMLRALVTSKGPVAIEIPVRELLTMDISQEGDDLSGANWVSNPLRVINKAPFSSRRAAKSTGSSVFQSKPLGRSCSLPELHGPSPVFILPKICCQLGKWTSLAIPLVNPAAETLELNVANSNPRNFTLQMHSGSALILKPHSATQLGVRFSPSSIGKGNHTARITFTCPQLQEWYVLLSGQGLIPESAEPLSISSPIGSNASLAIPFTNPTELPAVLSITLTGSDPRDAPSSHQAPLDKVFSIPLSHTEGIHIHEGASVDVPVVFAPDSMEQQWAWLCIAMEPCSSLANNRTSSTDDMRSEQESLTICWTYPICGIPTIENCPLGEVHCEVGCQLKRRVDVPLNGCLPANQILNRRTGQEVSQEMLEDFLCTVHSDVETERCFSASVEAVRGDLDSGTVTLTLNLVYAPLKPCRCSAVLTVRYTSGRTWDFPITLISTESKVSGVIFIEDKKQSFRLNSTTRWPEPFTAAFEPGSSNEFTVMPTSGMLPAVGSPGALIKVFFTPTTNGSHRARLTIKAAHRQFTYEVKGNTAHCFPPICTTSTLRPLNFVAQNLRLPALANSSPLIVRRKLLDS